MLSPASSNPTMASALVDRLRSDIVEGVYPPGYRLVIRDLCDRYGVSLIPMREALSRLTGSGFVIAESQRGFRVAAVSLDDMMDIARTRALIECEALKLSLTHGDVAWESRLVAAHHHLSRLSLRDDAGTGQLSAQWDDAHMAYHDALISSCRSPVLLELANNLRQRAARYRYLSVKAEAQPQAAKAAKQQMAHPPRDVAAEHKALTDAALARDVDLACELLRRHLETTAELARQEMLARSAAAE